MGEFEEKQKAPAEDETADFVMSMVDESAEEREPFEDIWDEVEDNFLVRPFQDDSRAYSSTEYPFANGQRPLLSDNAIIVDPKTHSAVMSIVSSIVISLFPEDGFTRARHVGFEDIIKANQVNKLMEYAMGLPGHFVEMLKWMMSVGVYGTGWLEGSWHFEEQAQTFRSLEVDEFGQEFSDSQILIAPVYDDIRFRVLPIRDGYPDKGTNNLTDIQGFTKSFSITAAEAMQRAEDGLYEMAAVKNAVESRGNEITKHIRKRSSNETVLDHEKELHPDFMELRGFERFGVVPWKAKDGIQRRVLTILEGETVRDKPWPRAIPFFGANIIPRINGPYGISPGELIRYDQDFANTLKMMIADAVVRATHPPQIYDENANVDLKALRQFKADRPVRAESINAVAQIPYNPPVAPAMQMYGVVNGQMDSASGAEGAFVGAQGPSRESATGFAGRLQQASQRPELFSLVMEREYLPRVGNYTLKLYQEFLEDTDDLRQRIGDSEGLVSLSSILADFDVRFNGTRIEANRLQELQAFREIAVLMANPAVAPLLPVVPLLQKYFERLGAPDLAGMVGNPQWTQIYMQLHQLSVPGQQAGNGNGNVATGNDLAATDGQNEGGVLGT